MEAEEQESAPGSAGRACDACRSRKVRCDRISPCSNCRMAKVACRFSPKINETRQRILISSRYEKQVESIDERLKGIEHNLQSLLSETRNQPNNANGSDPPRAKTMRKLALHPASSVSVRPDEDDRLERDPRLLDTSMLSHSMQAKSLFEKLNSRYPTTQSTRLKRAVATLQTTLKSQSERETVHELKFTDEKERATNIDLSELEVPPLEAVLELLRFCNETVPRFFLEFPVVQQSDFTEMCQTVYFYSTGYSPALFAVMNYGLFHLFRERWEVSKFADEERYITMCRNNFRLVVESFHLTLAPSLHACQALVLGATNATAAARPSLCLRLTSTAASMCLTLGYHRLPVTKIESRGILAKKQVFWAVYALDKGLSLSLGRSSIIQDCDISTTLPFPPEDSKFLCWHQLTETWAEFAKFQGRVFSELYTVASLSGPQADRESQARKLATELEDWQERKRKMVSVRDINSPYLEALDEGLDSTDVVCYAILTIIYQAIPANASPSGTSPVFYSECISSARKALARHRSAISNFKADYPYWKDYIHWTLLYSPFAPVMVVFCEAVATLNVADLNDLRDFVASLEPTSGISQGAARLHELCAAFYEVARAYFEVFSSLAPGVGPNDTTDHHLISSSSQPSNAGIGGSNGMQEPLASLSAAGPDETNMLDLNSYMTWPTEDWFLPDQYMMGMLDSDFNKS